MTGLPQPVVSWTKDGLPFNRHNLTSKAARDGDEEDVTFHEDGQKIHFALLATDHAGDYECRADNIAGSWEGAVRVVVEDSSAWKTPVIAGVTAGSYSSLFSLFTFHTQNQTKSDKILPILDREDPGLLSHNH